MITNCVNEVRNFLNVKLYFYKARKKLLQKYPSIITFLYESTSSSFFFYSYKKYAFHFFNFLCRQRTYISFLNVVYSLHIIKFILKLFDRGKWQ